MPTALSDPTTALYTILAAITLMLGVIALRRQKRSDVINFAIPAVALAALFIIDRMVESPREQIVKNLQEMEAASQNKKLDELFSHVSDKFQYKTLDKKGLRDKANQAESLPNWQGIKIGAGTLNRDGFAIKDDTAEQKFEVMPIGLPGNEYRYECTATFKNEGGKWRLIGCKFFKDGQEVTPPGL